MLFAPGTANRLGTVTLVASPSIVTVLDITIKGYGDYLIALLTSPEKITALIGVMLLSLWIGTESKDESGVGWIIWVVFFGSVSLSIASLLPSAFVFSEMPASRTFVVPSFILVMGLLATGLLTGKYLGSRTKIRNMNKFELGLMSIITIMIVFSTWITGTMLYGSRNTYIQFSERWDMIDAQITQAKIDGKDSVVIDAPKNWAGLNEPNDNPRFWVTRCYTLYYDIQVYGPNPDLQTP
jgi:hypothetical protein